MYLKVTDNAHLYQRHVTMNLLWSSESAPCGNNSQLHPAMSEFYIADQASITKSA